MKIGPSKEKEVSLWRSAPTIGSKALPAVRIDFLVPRIQGTLLGDRRQGTPDPDRLDQPHPDKGWAPWTN
jgi:hypothetical protein